MTRLWLDIPMRISKARNYIAVFICNFVMNTIATKSYRDTLSKTIQVGMVALDKMLEAQSDPQSDPQS